MGSSSGGREGSESLFSVSFSDTEVITGVGSDKMVGVRTSGSALESGSSSGAGVSSVWRVWENSPLRLRRGLVA